jgi:hypothetical protein
MNLKGRFILFALNDVLILELEKLASLLYLACRIDYELAMKTFMHKDSERGR